MTCLEGDGVYCSLVMRCIGCVFEVVAWQMLFNSINIGIYYAFLNAWLMIYHLKGYG